MTDELKPHRYFNCVVVVCKNEECQTVLVLQVLDEVTPRPGAPYAAPMLTTRCKDFLERCPVCGQEYLYGWRDTDVMVLANQTPGFLAPSFAGATAQAQAEIAREEI